MRTSKKMIGLDPDTENRGRPRLCTASRKFFVTVVLATVGGIAGAADLAHAPAYLIEPVLGLRVPLPNAKLDPLPGQVRATCVQMADNDTWTGRQWIFGAVNGDETTYYLVSGYFERLHTEPGEPRFHLPEQGGVYVIKDKDCGGDPAREVFDVRDFKAVPQAVLEQLAQDLKSRLLRAFGSDARLRARSKSSASHVTG